MKDYLCVREDGSGVLVSEMPTEEIIDYLTNGVRPLPGSTVRREDIIERFKIEILIRELGL